MGLGSTDANGGRPQTRYPAPGLPLDAAKSASKPSSPLAKPLPLRKPPRFAHPAAARLQRFVFGFLIIHHFYQLPTSA
ncbi:hypothetical protein T492DRAFT_892647 [Pavlovales sp. CCMP2436]|nr:hypothetical protein T492DRAFT_892647 [Pavlovales sp. CCMP2436]